MTQHVILRLTTFLYLLSQFIAHTNHQTHHPSSWDSLSGYFTHDTCILHPYWDPITCWHSNHLLWLVKILTISFRKASLILLFLIPQTQVLFLWMLTIFWFFSLMSSSYSIFCPVLLVGFSFRISSSCVGHVQACCE